MVISYNTKSLQQLCFDSEFAIVEIGKEAAISLRARHEEIRAARNVHDIPYGRISTEGNLCCLEVPNILTIEMMPNYPEKIGISFDWTSVHRIKLMRINNVN